MDVRPRRSLLFSLVLVLWGLLPTVPCTAGPVRAFVSILPQAYFVERVGGDHVRVDVLVGPGESPATYEPTPREVAALGEADVYFRIGTPFENAFVDKIARTLPGLRIVDTRRGVDLRRFRQKGKRQVPDPHIWLDPMRVKTQARTVCEALCDLAPALCDDFEDNLGGFHRDLEALDRHLRETLAPLRSRKILVFHPAFGYFCDAYGLEQIAVETEGKTPGPKRLADLIDRARAENIRIIFVQPQYSKKSARTIAEAISGAVVPLDPLARDHLDNLRRMAEAVREGLTRR
jgi:zinc transport system substrate-binding protein